MHIAELIIFAIHDAPIKLNWHQSTKFIYYPTIYIRSNFLLVLSHEPLNYSPVNKFDYWLALYHYLGSRFAVQNKQALIDMRDNDARTVRLWKETLCNKGKNEPCVSNFKIQ